MTLNLGRNVVFVREVFSKRLHVKYCVNGVVEKCVEREPPTMAILHNSCWKWK